MSLLGIFDTFNSAMQLGAQHAEAENDRAFQAEQAEIQRGFAHDEAQLAYERELQADSTKYQRQVQDLVRAGLNPMLAVNQSAGSVHSSPATSSIPSGSTAHLGRIDILAAKRFEMEQRVAEAQISNIEADTAKKESETAGNVLDNEIKAATKDALIETPGLLNQLNRAKITEINKGLDEADVRIGKMIEETKTEEEKRSLIAAQRILANAEARQITEMLPYTKQLTLAKTESERNAALLAAAHTAYQNKLIDDGYIDAFIKNMGSTAESAEARAEVDKIKAALRTGDYSKVGEVVRGNFAKDFMQDMTVLLDNLNPLNNLFK